MEKNVLGRTSIPVSAVADNNNDKICWWPIYHDDNECVGKLQRSINCTITSDETTQVKRILEETKETDGEAEIRERLQMLNSQLSDSISNLQEVYTSAIFVAICRGYWDKMGQIILKFLEGRKENRVWYSGSYHALGVLDDIFASQMQRLQGNALQEKDIEPLVQLSKLELYSVETLVIVQIPPTTCIFRNTTTPYALGVL